MDTELLKFFEDRIVGPIAEVRAEVQELRIDVKDVDAKVERHVADHQRRREQDAKRREQAKRALIGVAGAAASVGVTALVTQLFG